MALIGGSESRQTTKVKVDQEDRRIGATDSAIVATEGSGVTVYAADADLVTAALAGSRANVAEALAFSGRQAERERELMESALAGSGAHAATLRSGLLVAVAAAGLVALAAVWTR